MPKLVDASSGQELSQVQYSQAFSLHTSHHCMNCLIVSSSSTVRRKAVPRSSSFQCVAIPILPPSTRTALQGVLHQYSRKTLIWGEIEHTSMTGPQLKKLTFIHPMPCNLGTLHLSCCQLVKPRQTCFFLSPTQRQRVFYSHSNPCCETP